MLYNSPLLFLCLIPPFKEYIIFPNFLQTFLRGLDYTDLLKRYQVIVWLVLTLRNNIFCTNLLMIEPNISHCRFMSADVLVARLSGVRWGVVLNPCCLQQQIHVVVNFHVAEKRWHPITPCTQQKVCDYFLPGTAVNKPQI